MANDDIQTINHPWRKRFSIVPVRMDSGKYTMGHYYERVIIKIVDTQINTGELWGHYVAHSFRERKKDVFEILKG